MKVTFLPAFTDNYIWLIINEKTGVFDCIDPGDAMPVMQFAATNSLTLSNILLTHHHNDHIGGVNFLIKHFPSCQVIGPEDSRIPYVNQRVKKGMHLSLPPQHYEILSNPGHTSTHISYFETQNGWLFCGDTLFSAGCGRVFDGTMEELHKSLQMFKQLPASTQVYCAHEYTRQNLRFALTVEPENQILKGYEKKIKSQTCTLPSTIELERSINPFLRTDVRSIQDYALKHGALNKSSLEVFRTLRIQKNLFSG